MKQLYVVPNQPDGSLSPVWIQVTNDLSVVNNITYLGPDAYDDDEIWFRIESPITPSSIMSVNPLDVESSSTLIYRKEIPNYNPEDYICKRIYMPSDQDGAEVPCTMIYKKRTIFPSPVYQYGYGSYGVTIETNFNPRILTMVDNGFTYVYSHIRGGGMRGEHWYSNGKMEKKMNTFIDFISVSKYLIDTGIASKLCIEGRSAGGLLMGAVMTMRPGLYDVVVAGVAFVDVLTTMSDSGIPMTTQEWVQWGNPNIKKDYEKMKEYSPYNNIKPGSLCPR